MTSPRILLVDDQRQVSRMLRASLELSGQDYSVIDVSSGEEALNELERGPIDLLVTDLRLPGMSGLELLAKVRDLNPHARAIMITGAPTDEIQEEARALGVVAFLRKPLGTSFFLEAVDHALKSAAAVEAPPPVEEEESPRITERLAELRRELGAEAALLIADNGRVIARAGDLVDLDLDTTLPSLMAAFSSALKVSSLLGSAAPGNFQYFDGDAYDFYVTNVGASYGLLIAFRGRQGPGQMGSVVHFGRRAAGELLSALQHLGVVEAGPVVEDARPQPVPEPADEAANEAMEPKLETAAQAGANQDPQTFWDQAVAQSGAQKHAEGDALTYEQARKLGLLPEEPGK
jgi:CheY-like chemotaxis protein